MRFFWTDRDVGRKPQSQNLVHAAHANPLRSHRSSPRAKPKERTLIAASRGALNPFPSRASIIPDWWAASSAISKLAALLNNAIARQAQRYVYGTDDRQLRFVENRLSRAPDKTGQQLTWILE